MSAHRGSMSAAEADPFAGWLTLTEAAGQAGCTRQAIHTAVRSKRLPARQFPNGLWLVSKDELAKWDDQRKPQNSGRFGLSIRQAEVLIAAYRGRPMTADYSHFITTARALRKRGLIGDSSNQLTDKGKQVADQLWEQMRAGLGSPAGNGGAQ